MSTTALHMSAGPPDPHDLDEKIWFLQAQFEDGTVYELQVPDAFTQEQVVEMAQQVTYNP